MRQHTPHPIYAQPTPPHPHPRPHPHRRQATETVGPVLIHIMTEKGRGYAPAESASDKMHGVSKYDVLTGQQVKPKARVVARRVVGGWARGAHGAAGQAQGVHVAACVRGWARVCMASVVPARTRRGARCERGGARLWRAGVTPHHSTHTHAHAHTASTHTHAHTHRINTRAHTGRQGRVVHQLLCRRAARRGRGRLARARDPRRDGRRHGHEPL